MILRTAAPRLLPALLALTASAAAAAPPGSGKSPYIPPDPFKEVQPAEAPRELLTELAKHRAWIRRLVAAIRFERPGANDAAEHLRALLEDPDPRVRSAAVLAWTRRGEPAIPGALDREKDPRVLRTMLRCRWQGESERIERGARTLLKSSVPDERMLGVEIAGALAADGRASKDLTEEAKKTLSSIILRSDRETGGALSARIAVVTGAPDVHLDWMWRRWLDKHSRTMRLDQGMLAGEGAVAAPCPVAEMDDASFARFAGALDQLFRRPIDLGVAIDCTASMSGEIAAAQSGIEDLARFLDAGCPGTRLAIVGYRDRREDFTVKGWDFTASPQEARARLWQLWADGGGDEPELVQEALHFAYAKFGWRTTAQRVLVLVGDAPPTPGFGGYCVDAARAASRAGIVTHVLSARDPDKAGEVKHFPEIARAGGGRLVRLGEEADLVAEIAGVALSDTWHDHIVAVYRRYQLLCR